MLLADLLPVEPASFPLGTDELRPLEHLHEREPSEENPTASNDDQVVELLTKIHNQIDRAQRRERLNDFSLLRLFGSLLQMFAIVAAVWGVVAILGDRSGAATGRLLLACFLQLASISAMAANRFR